MDRIASSLAEMDAHYTVVVVGSSPLVAVVENLRIAASNLETGCVAVYTAMYVDENADISDR
jgi:hypothetical protein